MSAKKFTLIEMLVVVAIIGILASLMMPGMRHALDMSRSTSCQSNLKQHGTALCLYTTDNAGWLPVRALQSTSYMAYCWKWSLAPYLSLPQKMPIGTWSEEYRTGLLCCPQWNKTLSYARYEGGYGWNMQAGNSDRATDTYPRRNIQRLRKIGDTVVIQDSIDWSDSNESYYLAALYPSGASFPTPCVGDRHLGGVNSLWLDSHAAWKLQDELLEGKGVGTTRGSDNVNYKNQDYFYAANK